MICSARVVRFFSTCLVEYLKVVIAP